MTTAAGDTEVTEGLFHMPSTFPKEGLVWIGEAVLTEEVRPFIIKAIWNEGKPSNDMRIHRLQKVKFLCA